MKISLIGYMGSGKSFLGKELASCLKLPFIDLDAEIEASSGYTITETIFNKGELYFRQLERQELTKALAQEAFVLATGGGTPCYYDNIDLINNNSLSVFLHYGVAELYERLEGSQAERPLIAHLQGAGLKEYIAKHLFERMPYYDQSVVTIRASQRSQEDIIDEIIALVNE